MLPRLKDIFLRRAYMIAYEMKLKNTLFALIDEMEEHVQDFVYNPGKDCSRRRKMCFSDFIKFTLSMGAKSTNNELLQFFSFSGKVPTASAYTQQKAKIKPEAFKVLLDQFTNTLSQTKTYHDYKLIACDGSEINIHRGCKGDDTFIQSGDKNGYSLMHLSVFFDLLNGIYLDEIISTKRTMNERAECIEMIDRSPFNKVLLLADRGYENYNLFAHAEEKGWNYLIRVKDMDVSNGIVHGCYLNLDGEFDTQKDIIITRSDRNFVKEHKDVYKRITYWNRRFDYIELGDLKSEYPMTLRIVRIKIDEEHYETLITNLDANEFPPGEIKKLYHLRWGVETSFRELKYYVGMINFHAKKPDYISQEIYAALLIYNFCKTVINHIPIPQKKHQKYQYRLNVSAAISICRYFLFGGYVVDFPLEMLLQKYLTPIRLNRSFPRKVADQKPVSLNYRLA